MDKLLSDSILPLDLLAVRLFLTKARPKRARMQHDAPTTTLSAALGFRTKSSESDSVFESFVAADKTILSLESVATCDATDVASVSLLSSGNTHSQWPRTRFGLRETAEAAWDHFKGVEKHCGNGGLYKKAAKPYTILEDFTMELHSNNSRADMKVKQIVRRYVESERDMVLFVSGISPIETRHKAIDGMMYHLRGYVVTKPSPASTAGHELTMLQFCSRISIDKEPGVIYDREHVRAVIRFIIGNTVGNIRCYQERIENLLVDRCTITR